MIDRARLDARLALVGARPGLEIAGLQVAVVDGGEIVHEHCSGRRWIDPSGSPAGDLPVTPDSKFRVASISKTVVGVAVMSLVEEGLLDLDRDVGDYLGFGFRNPARPGKPISIANLLSHTSSLRDLERYNVPFGGSITELLGDEGRWADEEPGTRYCYCNLGYGIVASAMERVTGGRFDRVMTERVFRPLGLDASYNVATLSDKGIRELGVLYRKNDEEGNWDASLPWRAQVDDHRGRRPAAGCSFRPGFGPADLESYVPGTNGTLFSPQGGLRISARDLSTIARCLLAGGSLGGARVLSPASVRAMMTPRWTWDPARDNGDVFEGISLESGIALFHGTDTWDGTRGDRLLPGGGPRLWDHHAEAYGLFGGFLLAPEEGFGAVYLVTGTAADPERHRGRHSGYFLWEEEIMEAILEEAGWRGPRRTR